MKNMEKGDGGIKFDGKQQARFLWVTIKCKPRQQSIPQVRIENVNLRKQEKTKPKECNTTERQY